MRPIELQPVAYGTAEHFVDRRAQRLGLDVDQSVLDRADCLLIDTARRLPGGCVEKRGDPLDRPRVLPNQKPVGELVDDAGQPLRAIALHVFRPADDPVVGGNLEKRVDPPAGIAVQVFDFCDLHRGASMKGIGTHTKAKKFAKSILAAGTDWFFTDAFAVKTAIRSSK